MITVALPLMTTTGSDVPVFECELSNDVSIGGGLHFISFVSPEEGTFIACAVPFKDWRFIVSEHSKVSETELTYAMEKIKSDPDIVLASVMTNVSELKVNVSGLLRYFKNKKTVSKKCATEILEFFGDKS